MHLSRTLGNDARNDGRQGIMACCACRSGGAHLRADEVPFGLWRVISGEDNQVDRESKSDVEEGHNFVQKRCTIWVAYTFLGVSMPSTIRIGRTDVFEGSGRLQFFYSYSLKFIPLGCTMPSSSCKYGLRATLYLAALEPEGCVSAQSISDELEIPSLSSPQSCRSYLTRVY